MSSTNLADTLAACTSSPRVAMTSTGVLDLVIPKTLPVCLANAEAGFVTSLVVPSVAISATPNKA